MARAMRLFRRMTLVAVLATFLLVTIGGLVRSTDSGLGCSTDWPGCNGQLLPDLTQAEVAIEFSHRVVAGIVGLLILAVAVLAVRYHRRRPAIVGPAVLAVAVVMLQAWLGRIVVVEELEAVYVAVHLTTAMILLALVTYLALAAASVDRPPLAPKDRSIALRSGAAAAGVLVLLVVGSYLAGFGDASVIPGWPLMNGRLVPQLAFEPHAVHFVHRLLAAVVGILVFYAAASIIKRKAEMPLQARLAHAAAGLYAVEVLIGAANVWTQLSAAAVTAHLAVGALIWTALVAIAVISHPALAWRRTSGTVSPELVGASR